MWIKDDLSVGWIVNDSHLVTVANEWSQGQVVMTEV